jgi:outer membrane usher protein
MLAASGSPALASGEPGVYLVRPGDTLYSISQSHSSDVETLAALNNLADPGLIQAGQTLRLPESTTPAPGARVPDRVAASQNFDPEEEERAIRAEQEAAVRRSSRLEASSEAIATMPLLVVFERRRFPPAIAELTPQELVAVSPSGLAASLEPVLAPEVARELQSLGSDPVPPARFRDLGIELSLDPGTLTIQAGLTPEARGGVDVFVGTPASRAQGELIMPSRFALGATAAVNARRQLDDDITAGDVLVSGFANAGGIDGLNLEYGARYYFSDVFTGDRFQRGRTLLFHDDRRNLVRYAAGDVSPVMPRFAGTFDVLGAGLERNYRTLEPGRNVRPTGRRSLVLERASTIEVYVNGALVDRIQAGPGPVNLADIPLIGFSNNVVLVVEDELGRRELDSFSLGADITLLAPGLTEFSLSAGLVRDPLSSTLFDYTRDVGLGGSITRGLTNTLTLGGHALYSPAVSNAGANAVVSAFAGVASFEASLSDSRETGTGHSVGINYRGGPYLGVERNDTLTLRADYYSESYAAFDDPGALRNLQWDLGADYSVTLSATRALSLGASYNRTYDADDANVNVFAGITQRVNLVNLSVTGRYSRRSTGEDDFGVFLSLTRPFGQRQFGSLSYDSITGTSRAEFRRYRGVDMPEIDYRVSAVRSSDATDVSGRAGFANTRFSSEVQIDSRVEGPSRPDTVSGRLQSGIAIVDGAVGVGRDPGLGFYMFRRHETLRDAQIDVRSGAFGRTRGRADILGPAVVPVLQPYREEALQLFIQNAPMGYNVGETRFNMMPGARSGSVVMVGGDSYRTAIATLLHDGEPVALRYGVLTNRDTGEESIFFTNRAGRAAFNDLSPGAYSARVDGIEEGITFEIGSEDDALINLGTFSMEVEP